MATREEVQEVKSSRFVLVGIIGKVGQAFGLGHLQIARKVYGAICDLVWRRIKCGVYDIEGIGMYFDPHGEWGRDVRGVIKDHGIEPLTTMLFKDTVKVGDSFADVGACFGYYSLIGAGLVGKAGRIVAFEPWLSNKEQVCRNIEINNLSSIVEVHQKAVGDTVGRQELFLSELGMGSHTLRIGHNGGFKKESVSVDVTTIDEFYKDKKLDIIKMDVEGYETQVIRGARKTLHGVRSIFMEYCPRIIIEAGCDPHEVLDILMKEYHTCYAITDIGDAKERGVYRMDNVERVIELASSISSGVNLFITNRLQ